MHTTEHANVDFSIDLHIKASPVEAFLALAEDLGKWWGEMDRPVSSVQDVFTVSWGEPWYRFKVLVFSPPTQLVWECIDANQIIGDMKGVEKEWVGTKLHWKIAELDTNTLNLSLIHEGLVPQFVCYDFCSTTWERFIYQHLKPYLEGTIQKA